MAERVERGNGGWSGWRLGGWGVAALILLLPAVAMQAGAEVDWGPEDFAFAGLLIGGVGLAFELAVRRARSWTYRLGVAATLAAAFLIIWVNAAVGMIGDEDNPYNLLFLGVILLALAGAAIARFRPAGMAMAMVVAAVAHAGVALAGMSSDARGGLFSVVLAAPWLVSAALFAGAARGRRRSGTGGDSYE